MTETPKQITDKPDSLNDDELNHEIDDIKSSFNPSRLTNFFLAGHVLERLNQDEEVKAIMDNALFCYEQFNEPNLRNDLRIKSKKHHKISKIKK